MAKFTVGKGIDEYTLKLSKMAENADEVAGKAIFAGAKIIADDIKSRLQALPVVSEAENIQSYRAGQKAKLSYRQRKGLVESFGITKMEKDQAGFYNVKLGFDGYNTIKTKKYPKGQPNAMIARIVENGSSYMEATPFIRKAISAQKKNAIEEMNRVINEEYEKLMK